MNEQGDPALILSQTEGETPHKMAAKPHLPLIAFTSLCFILLQSACAAVMTISGLRLLIGVGSLAFASTGLKLLDSIHADVIRIPMTIVAAAGSIINLYVVWRIRSLRARPSSRWRTAPPSPDTQRAENIQMALAFLTLLLIAIELAAHHHLFHHV